jgi:hypothetical protein
MTEQKMRFDRQELIKQCLEKALEIVDAVNAVPHCRVHKVLKAEPLYEGLGAIRIDITLLPHFAERHER